MSVFAFPICFALAAASCWWAAKGLRDDARRLSNAGRIALAFLLCCLTLTVGGNTSVTGLAMLLMFLSPLLALALVVFLLVNGVTMMRREGRSLGNLLSLLAGIAIAGAMAVALALLVVAPKLLPVSLWLVLAGGWVALLFFGYVGYAALYQRRVAQTHPDYVVTLDSGLIGDRVPPLLASRIVRAIGLYGDEVAAGRTPVLVMSGGKGSDERCSEAEAMGRYALDHGVPEEDLRLETASATTRQNLTLTRQLVADDPRLGPNASGVAVTSNHHAMRAAMLARSLDLPIDAVGAPTAGYFWPSAVLREFVAVLKGSLVLQVVAFLLVTLPLPVMLAVAIWR